MASLATACRLSARIAGRRIPADFAARGFRTSAYLSAAQNFTMPALSPTMTEGNIATWKVKEGDSFSAGDVLLEIETDKATMDVEAQDDGVLMKIFSADGSKAVQVGTRIAVIAEAGDDVSALEIPADESPAKPQQDQQQQQQKQEEASTSAGDESSTSTSRQGRGNTTPGETHEQKYPLLPSVQSLVNQHGINADTLARITPTGPQGRLLKGDILAHLGTINPDTPSKITQRFQTLSKLDLSNIKVAPKRDTKTDKKDSSSASGAARAQAQAQAQAEPEAPQEAELTVPVSLSKVIEAQRRIQDTLGVFMPLTTFIARAAEVANDDLPPSNHRQRNPTTNELFDQVLGLDKLRPKSSRGFYLPQVSALPEPSFTNVPPPQRKGSNADIIDILAGGGNPSPKMTSGPVPLPGLSAKGTNLFSLVVPRGDEKRATVFLERVKVILEKDPGRLVL